MPGIGSMSVFGLSRQRPRVNGWECLVHSSVQTMQAQIKRNADDPQQTSAVGIRGKHRCPSKQRSH